NNTSVTDFTIPKNPEYSLMYFTFDNDGMMVDVAPKKTEWDVVFTKYTFTYCSEPVNSPFRYYLVTGALLNKWSGCVNEQYRKDSTQLYAPFETFDASRLSDVNFNTLAAKIGFSWKDYDFTLGYIIIPDRFYLVRDTEGYVYKIRFYDFYDDQGNEGAAKFEYKRL
ncbi:MAG: HmuY family protein, partial [Bacteroidota bacterium]